MAQQPLDQLVPNDIVVTVQQKAVKEPNCPGDATDKMKRLRMLLWSGAWSDQDTNLIAWCETRGCWHMWKA